MKKNIVSNTSNPILLVDDEIHALQGYEMQLLGEGFDKFISCQNGKEALNVLASQKVSLILLDLKMPEMSGEEVLSIVSMNYQDIPVIIITAVDDVNTAVRCMKAGAYDYLTKPVDQARLITTVRRAIEYRELQQENVLLKESVLNKKLRRPEAFSKIITKNEKMFSIFRYIESISTTSQPVLITGETGVGKELIARAIHELSDRPGQLVAVNIAGLDDNIFSDTLFGHKRGAFTGADRVREGLIEKAVKGTLFLDEIGDLNSASQVKLLRLLQEQDYYPLGSDVPKKSDARVIVATNHNLKVLLHEDKFRADLYYRLLSHHITMPPLRERKDDIPLLTEYFLQESADELGKLKPTCPPELFTLFSMYNFPGNIRELKAMTFDAVSRHESGILSLASFKEKIGDNQIDKNFLGSSSSIQMLYDSLDKLPSIDQSEDLLIQEALKRANGNQTVASLMLGITRQTLHRKLQLKNKST